MEIKVKGKVKGAYVQGKSCTQGPWGECTDQLPNKEGLRAHLQDKMATREWDVNAQKGFGL